MSKFNPGDVVVLNSGSVPMSVSHTTKKGKVHVVWFDVYDNLCSEKFPEPLLTAYDDAEDVSEAASTGPSGVVAASGPVDSVASAASGPTDDASTSDVVVATGPTGVSVSGPTAS